ncbi:hypothetical protein [Sporosarcina sp. G11-34]|uniref:hypothetical protein n=1 Tax=Sporosarcina sp. G11-34 TaxID=2849605 RepID=UPI0022A90FA2|nr:hypothetical protein [Sporosarcina sp. G11-34]MCZ2260618.1 hypothetical protein [Sporosarcina sp. G11-34]
MTYDEVIAIIGEEGTLNGETRTKYSVLTSHMWKNDTGGYALIHFNDENTGTPIVYSFMFVDIPDEE